MITHPSYFFSLQVDVADHFFSAIMNWIWKLKFKISNTDGRRLYQNNKDEFFIQVLLLTSFFRIKSLQVIKEKIF